MTRRLLLAALAATCCSTPALASDGLRVWAGPLVGYDDVELDAIDQATGDKFDIGGDSAVMYGGMAGVDVQLTPNGTFGVEAEFADSDAARSETDLLVTGDRARISAGRDLYAGVRGSYFVTPRVGIYAKLGYTNARVKLTYDDGTGPVRGHTNFGGFRFGSGVEFVVNPHLGIRAEYRRSEYKSKDSGFGFNVDANRDQGVLAVVAGF